MKTGLWRAMLCGVALATGGLARAAVPGSPYFYIFPPALTADTPFTLRMGRTGATGGGDFPPLAATRIYVTRFEGTAGVTRTFDGMRQSPQGFEVRYDVSLPAGSYEIWYYDAESPDFTAPPDASASIVVTAEGFVRVIEFVHAGSGHYFMTADEEEIRRLDDGRIAGWVRTGEWFKAIPGRQDTIGTAHVCRLYGLPAAGLDTHFFSDDPDECAGTLARWPGRWVRESDSAFGLPPDYGCDGLGDQPIYRLFNNRPDVNHRYTISPAVRDAMIAAGWIPEARHDGLWACTLQ